MSSVFDFRTELYRLHLPIYKVAAQVNLHPSRLSLYLNGHLPMPPHVYDRLQVIVLEHQREQKPVGL